MLYLKCYNVCNIVEFSAREWGNENVKCVVFNVIIYLSNLLLDATRRDETRVSKFIRNFDLRARRSTPAFFSEDIRAKLEGRSWASICVNKSSKYRTFPMRDRGRPFSTNRNKNRARESGRPLRPFAACARARTYSHRHAKSVKAYGLNGASIALPCTNSRSFARDRSIFFTDVCYQSRLFLCTVASLTFIGAIDPLRPVFSRFCSSLVSFSGEATNWLQTICYELHASIRGDLRRYEPTINNPRFETLGKHFAESRR